MLSNAMTSKTSREGFELLAKDAEERAALVKDPQTRDAWLRVAAGYRELAEHVPDSTVKPPQLH